MCHCISGKTLSLLPDMISSRLAWLPEFRLKHISPFFGFPSKRNREEEPSWLLTSTCQRVSFLLDFAFHLSDWISNWAVNLSPHFNQEKCFPSTVYTVWRVSIAPVKLVVFIVLLANFHTENISRVQKTVLTSWVHLKAEWKITM